MSHAQKQRNRLKGKRLYEGWIQQVRRAEREATYSKEVKETPIAAAPGSPAWKWRPECRRLERRSAMVRQDVDCFVEHIAHCQGCRRRYDAAWERAACELTEEQVRASLCKKGYQALKRQRNARTLNDIEFALEQS